MDAKRSGRYLIWGQTSTNNDRFWQALLNPMVQIRPIRGRAVQRKSALYKVPHVRFIVGGSPASVKDDTEIYGGTIKPLDCWWSWKESFRWKMEACRNFHEGQTSKSVQRWESPESCTRSNDFELSQPWSPREPSVVIRVAKLRSQVSGDWLIFILAINGSGYLWAKERYQELTS